MSEQKYPPDPISETYTQENQEQSVWVQVELPWQGMECHFVRFNFDEDLEDPFIPDECRLIRKIIYIQVQDINGNPVLEFDPPLVMKAVYIPSDLEEVCGDPEKLYIAIYDHNYHEWHSKETTIDTNDNTGTITVNQWTSHACWKR